MHRLTLTRIGDAVGVVLPEGVLAKLGPDFSGPLYLADTQDGLLLSPYDAHTRQQLDAGRAFLRDHDVTLRALTR